MLMSLQQLLALVSISTPLFPSLLIFGGKGKKEKYLPVGDRAVPVPVPATVAVAVAVALLAAVVSFDVRK